MLIVWKIYERFIKKKGPEKDKANYKPDEDDQGNEVQTEEDPADKEYEQVLDDPELKEKAQLPDVDPAKIKVEKKDMSGK